MSTIYIHNVQVMQPGEGIIGQSLTVQDGKIAQIAGPPPNQDGIEQLDGQGRLLTPGLIDVHVNGLHKYNFDQGPESLLEAAKLFGRHGTTTFIATVQPMMRESWYQTLRKVAEAIPDIEGAHMPGMHLEGPFVSVAGAASDPTPGNVALTDDLIDMCQGRMSVMSVAPDVENIVPVIERLMERGVVPFVTHTRANVEQSQRAIDAGARHATHFYDVFPVPEVTEPGVRPCGAVEAYLADPRATVDFICDGVHVDPIAIKAALAAKGWEGVILITDGNVGSGLPPGTYDTPWGYPVNVKAGDACRIADPSHPMNGVLAGSALTMDTGMNNLMQWLNIPSEQIWAMGTSNPARIMGMQDKGVVREGADGDLVLWDEIDGGYQVAHTWLGGQTVYEAG